MKAFHNDPKIKETYLARVRAHREADQIIQSYGYWNEGKGCAVGCTLHSDNHAAYETELGIPQVLARLEDGIFEGVSVERSKSWPEDFLAAIPVGADLSLVWPKFAIWLLTDPDHGVIRFSKTPQVVEKVAILYSRLIAGDQPTHAEWSAAYAAAAYAAADAARAAARAAADAAHARGAQATKLLQLLSEAR